MESVIQVSFLVQIVGRASLNEVYFPLEFYARHFPTSSKDS